ncbi:hypothetical protein HZA97_06375 [Candidatus Woesearchaeota archaeon]|nr:hypothetical protein [Candidatus Woesearchaeota archaeon]
MLIEEPQNIVNALGDKIDPLLQKLHGFLGNVEWFLGGFFGLYAIYFFFSLLKQRKEVKLLKEIKQEMSEIKEAVVKKKPQKKENAD